MLTLRRGLWLTAVFVIAAAVALILTSDRMPELTEERLTAALQKWRDVGVTSYRLRLSMEGSELDRLADQLGLERCGVENAEGPGRHVVHLVQVEPQAAVRNVEAVIVGAEGLQPVALLAVAEAARRARPP